LSFGINLAVKTERYHLGDLNEDGRVKLKFVVNIKTWRVMECQKSIDWW
jgi:hypothetical protein